MRQVKSGKQELKPPKCILQKGIQALQPRDLQQPGGQMSRSFEAADPIRPYE